MPHRSKFVANKDVSQKGELRFESWLKASGYSGASNCYPAAVHAATLVPEFLADYPYYARYRKAIEAHAEEVGWVSDYEIDEDDEPDEPLGYA